MPELPPARRSPAGRPRPGYWTVAFPAWAAVSAIGVGLHLGGVISRVDAEGLAVVSAAFTGALRYAILILRG